MYPQARVGDYSMGHWIGIFYFPPTNLIEGSKDTISCFIPACRVGDRANVHIAWILGIVPLPPFNHQPTAIEGAPCTFINGLPAFRVGDGYSCGDKQAQGCVTHLVGDICVPPVCPK